MNLLLLFVKCPKITGNCQKKLHTSPWIAPFLFDCLFGSCEECKNVLQPTRTCNHGSDHHTRGKWTFPFVFPFIHFLNLIHQQLYFSNLNLFSEFGIKRTPKMKNKSFLNFTFMLQSFNFFLKLKTEVQRKIWIDERVQMDVVLLNDIRIKPKIIIWF